MNLVEDSKINLIGWAFSDPDVIQDDQKLRFSVNGEAPENIDTRNHALTYKSCFGNERALITQ